MSLYRGPSLIGTSNDTTHAQVLSATAAALTAANNAAAVAAIKISVDATLAAVTATKAAIDVTAAANLLGPVVSFNTRVGPVVLTAADVTATGFLNNVNNTADANKPVSTAQAAADALKVDTTAMTAALLLKANTGDVQTQLRTAATTTGTSVAYVIVTAPVQAALTAAQRYRLRLHVANGTSPTLARDGLAARPIMLYNVVGAKTAPSANALPTLFDVEYDGTDYVVLNPLPATGGATGASGETLFVENSRVMAFSYTLSAGKSASMVGPLTIATGAVLTIPTNQRLVVL